MPELTFEFKGAEALPFCAEPQLAFKLLIANLGAEGAVHTVVLKCQIRIEATRRKYTREEQTRLYDLFDEPSRWGQTLNSMLWMNTSVVVPGFIRDTLIDVPVPCTFDFNVAATKYFAGVEEGDIPLCFFFSGTVFYQNLNGVLQVAQIPWDREARYRLPVCVWREMMELYYPNSGWLCLRRDVFDKLSAYKRTRGIPTWEETLESMFGEIQKEENAQIS